MQRCGSLTDQEETANVGRQEETANVGRFPALAHLYVVLAIVGSSSTAVIERTSRFIYVARELLD